jgi:transcriptional regulator with XRE-family HTH domain
MKRPYVDVFEAIMAKENLNKIELSEKLEVGQSTIVHILNGRNQPGFFVSRKLFEKFSNVNPLYFFCGEGEIFLTNPITNREEAHLKEDKEKAIELLFSMVQILENQICKNNETIRNLLTSKHIKIPVDE